jgi:hypothetical protein
MARQTFPKVLLIALVFPQIHSAAALKFTVKRARRARCALRHAANEHGRAWPSMAEHAPFAPCLSKPCHALHRMPWPALQPTPYRADQYRMRGKGATKGIFGGVVVTINQPIRSLIRDGINTKIAPTVTYFMCVHGGPC